MKTDSYLLLNELREITKLNLQSVTGFKSLSNEQLNYKPFSQSWSILQCLEHLNYYAAFYHPYLKKSILTSTAEAETFKSGFWGNYLVKMLIPGSNSKKMKTFKSMDPSRSVLSGDVLERFIESQKEMLDLIEKAFEINLNKGGIPVTFTKLIRLKTGDTLRFMVYHNQRHITQALRLA
ncbi:DinB family protein [Flavobacterium sp.]|uniref:DinB family protein n=1 Tax=Flavobacterium sp. TaxID=239 RepID=UPI00261418DC|nr:DinB family protein [Flavobacterium sp.]